MSHTRPDPFRGRIRPWLVSHPPASRAVERALHPWHHVLKPWLVARGGTRRPVEQNLVVSGVPRGGTTWLAEVLGGISRSALLYEPLNLDGKEAAARGLSASPRLRFVPPEGEWPEGETFLRKLLTGERIVPRTLRHTGLREALAAETWIVKLVVGSRLLRWLAETFPLPPPVLLLRHPCAVVASRIRLGWKERAVRPHAAPGLLDGRPELERLLEGLETPEERMAADWCLDVHAALSTPEPHPWTVVTYEELVVRGVPTLGRIFGAWGRNVPEASVARLRTPSATTATGAGVLEGAGLLAGWTRQLEGEEVERILSVVSAFGLDFYGPDPEPDHRRIPGHPGVGIG